MSEEARELLDTEGESGRFEFKRDAAAVKATVLVAAANWVASDRAREMVTLLVGVDEVEDATTGLARGQIRGLPDLHQSIERIQNVVGDTLPTPVDVTFIEEGTKTDTPFLRLEIRPTYAPHFDSSGRRVTRNNASTRPLSDEEMLDIYLNRESIKFEERFSAIVDEVTQRVVALSAQLEEVADRIDHASSAAWEAASNADESRTLAERLDYDIQSVLEKVENPMPSNVRCFFELREKRQTVWRRYSYDVALRPTKATPKLTARLRAVLAEPIDPEIWAANRAETELWEEVLKERGDRGSMAQWSRAVRKREEFQLDMAPQLDDIIGQLTREAEDIRND
ncbi:hypothetical protein HH308_01400 [Gordonia sp. TBRC 11910]|uniref:DNA-binding protein n=1 Tax=Gordonia asplenii TaxID=2725283 RepID=A0A848KNL2_9ACTN|nr:hypothetical protein [Gordonia asplenii]NMN99869.1 hypothetical protein [Gordonia asplenii]